MCIERRGEEALGASLRTSNFAQSQHWTKETSNELLILCSGKSYKGAFEGGNQCEIKSSGKLALSHKHLPALPQKLQDRSGWTKLFDLCTKGRFLENVHNQKLWIRTTK